MKPPVDEIICGDNVEVMVGWPDECIDLTITSPPYDLVDYDDNGNLITHSDKGLRQYNGYEWDFAAVARQLYRVTKQGRVLVWIAGDHTIDGSETGASFRQALYFMSIGFRLHDTMLYARHSKPLNHCRYEQDFEYMFVLSKGAPAVFNGLTKPNLYPERRDIKGYHRDKNGVHKKTATTRKETGLRGNIWHYSVGKGGSTNDSDAFEHPAIFPEQLAKDHILSWSKPGDLVLDCFVGSGTVPKMCVLTDRHFAGIDISESYVELSKGRVAAVQQQPRLFSWDLQPATNGRPKEPTP